MSFLPIIREFIDCEINVKNHSTYTVDGYIRYLDEFHTFLPDKEPKDLLFSDILAYRKHLNEKGLSLRTQNIYLITLRNLLRFCFLRDIPTLDPKKVELSKIPKKPVDYLELGEIERILKQIDLKTVIGLRDMAIIHTFICTGMRVGELVKMNWRDVDTKTKEFVIQGKGGKPRPAFLSPQAAYYIREYMATRKDYSDALFINYRNARQTTIAGEKRRLSCVAVQSLVRNYGKKARIQKKVVPHIFRHSFGTHLLRGGANLRYIQELLGHEQITTTQIYTHVTSRDLKETCNDLFKVKIFKESYAKVFN